MYGNKLLYTSQLTSGQYPIGMIISDKMSLKHVSGYNIKYHKTHIKEIAQMYLSCFTWYSKYVGVNAIRPGTIVVHFEHEPTWNLVIQ